MEWYVNPLLLCCAKSHTLSRPSLPADFMSIHEIHHACPTCTGMFRPIAIKNIVSTAVRNLNLHESRTPDRLLEIIEAMLGVLKFKGQVSGPMIVRGLVGV